MATRLALSVELLDVLVAHGMSVDATAVEVDGVVVDGQPRVFIVVGGLHDHRALVNLDDRQIDEFIGKLMMVRDQARKTATAFEDGGEPRNRQPHGPRAHVATQQGAATPGQDDGPAAGNVAEPQLGPTPDRAEHPPSSPLLLDTRMLTLARTAFSSGNFAGYECGSMTEGEREVRFQDFLAKWIAFERSTARRVERSPDHAEHPPFPPFPAGRSTPTGFRDVAILVDGRGKQWKYSEPADVWSLVDGHMGPGSVSHTSSRSYQRLVSDFGPMSMALTEE